MKHLHYHHFQRP